MSDQKNLVDAIFAVDEQHAVQVWVNSNGTVIIYQDQQEGGEQIIHINSALLGNLISSLVSVREKLRAIA